MKELAPTEKPGRAGAESRTEVSGAAEKRVDEVVGLRGEDTETWTTESGRKVTDFFAEPKWFKDGSDKWARVDPRVVADPNVPGAFMNAGAAWHVSFGPSDNGVKLRVGSRTLSLVLPATKRVQPELDGADASAVWYRDVLPGVDARFRVSATGVEQDFVIQNRGGLGSLNRLTLGLDSEGVLVPAPAGRGGSVFDWNGNGKTVFDGDNDGPRLRIGEVAVSDAKGNPVASAGASLSSDETAALLSKGARTQRDLRFSFAAGFGASLSDAQFPVTIDPLFQTSSGTWQSYNSAGTVTTGSNQWGLLGNWGSGTADPWRYNLSLGYSYLWTNIAANAQVFSANLKLVNSPNPTAVAPVFDTAWPYFPTAPSTGWNATVCHASAWSYAGAYPGWDVNKCNNWAYISTAYPVPDSVDGSGATTYVDVTNMVRPWVAAHDPNGVFGVSMDYTTAYNFKVTIPTLQITWDTPSSATTPIGPVDGETITSTTPTLSVNTATDVDSGQSPELYNFVVFAGKPTDLGVEPSTSCNEGLGVWHTSYQTGTTAAVPAGVLQDGVTYYWTVATMGSTLPGYPTCSGPWKFKVDRRLGDSGVSPTQAVGPVTVNLANGNVMTAAGSHSVATVGGGMGVSLTYNSQSKRHQGLRASYYGGTLPWFFLTPTLSWDGPAFSQRVDDNIDFDWGINGPVVAGPLDNFTAQWTGYVTVPVAGTYCFGTNADDGTQVWVGGYNTLNHLVDQSATDTPCDSGRTVTMAAGETRTITVRYYDRTANASVQLKVFGGPTGTQVVPSSWLSTDIEAAGPRWSFSDGDLSIMGAQASGSGITLTTADGSTVEFIKTDTGAYVGPAGDSTRVSVDKVSGDINVDADTMSYHYNSGGMLLSAVAATDDRQPAATVYEWSAASSPVPKLVKMTDPASSPAQSVNLYYGGDSNCTSSTTTPSLPSGFAIVPGLLCKVVSFDGQVSEFYYNGGNLGRVIQPGGATTDYTYDSNGQLLSVRQPLAGDAIAAGKRANDATVNWEISYDGSGRASVVTAPAALAGGSRQTVTMAYVSAPSGGTPGVSTVTLSGVTNPSGYTKRVEFDTAYRSTKVTDANGVYSTVAYDGTSDRVAYSDQAVGTAQATRTSTIYDNTVVFNNTSPPVISYGPAPVSAFNVAGGVATPNGTMAVPTTSSAYDETITGLSAAWWDDTPGVGETYTNPNRPSFRGAPKLHTRTPGDANWNWGSSSPDPTVIPVDNFSGRLSGVVNLTTAGNWTFAGKADDGLRMTIDDRLVVDTWGTPTLKATSAPFNLVAGWHRINVDFREDGGGALLQLWFTPPGGTETTIPNANMKPDLGLVTTTTDATGVVSTTGYARPLIGLATSTSVDPTGLNLTSTSSYESAGTGLFTRRLTRALPADAAASRNTNTYTYYTASDVSPSLTCAGTGVSVSSGIAQRGQAKTSRASDPNTAGGTGGISREQVQDLAGRVVASRVSTDSKWGCTAFDSRGRPSAQTSPAGGGQPERTVTFNYAVGSDPFLSSVSDPAGTITTRVDLLGRVTDTSDALGVITHTDYDSANRPTQGTVFKTTGAVIERTMTDYETSGAGVNQAKTMRWSNAAATVTGYNYTTFTASSAMPTVTGTALTTSTFDAIGRTSSVDYSSGVRATFGFDTYQRPNSLIHTKGGVTLFSDVVTRDIAGRVIDRTVNGTDPRAGNNNYVYDTAGRLTDWWERDVTAGVNDNGTYRYTYTGGQPAACTSTWGNAASAGKNSNRVESTLQINGGTVQTTKYCYDFADRLQKVIPASTPGTYDAGFAYDTHGNTTTAGAQVFTYDGADRHIASTVGATTVSYTRDAADRIITRSVGGVVAAKYAFTGAGDTSDLTLDASNNVVEVTLNLAGGVLMTTRTAGDVWSYPNTHGDLVLTTNATGSQTGTIGSYDPFGNPLGTTAIDNSTGNFDYGWHGTAQRPVDHETGFQPTIEMGARPYQPALGRFLAVDPVEGGTLNDYVYVADPVNGDDLDGRAAAGVCGSGKLSALWITVTGELCFFIDDHGDTLFTIAIGGGVGRNTGASFAGVASSVKHVRDLLGLSGCASVSAGRKAASGCAFRGGDGHWYSTWSFGKGTKGIGADASLMYAWSLPGMFRGSAKKLLKKSGCNMSSRRRLRACRTI